MLHRLLFWIGLGLSFPVSVLIAQTLCLDLTWSTRLYVLGLALIVAGLVSLPLRRRRRPRWPVTRLGTALIALTLLLRAATANGDRAVQDSRALPSPADWPPSWLLGERDLVLSGGRMLQSARHLPRAETRGLVTALASAYDEIEAGAGPKPRRISLPAVDGDRRVTPALVITAEHAPATPAAPVGVLFLHGYAGNFTWPCWAVAQAAQIVSATTLCPSLGFKGDWWSEGGERVVRDGIAWLRARGARRVYLAGLSNGAAGVAVLAPLLGDQIDGAILISGARRGGSTASLPTLMIQGSGDTMMRAARVRRFARAQRGALSYRELEGNHFVMLHRWPEVRAIIEAWLQQPDTIRRPEP